MLIKNNTFNPKIALVATMCSIVLCACAQNNQNSNILAASGQNQEQPLVLGNARLPYYLPYLQGKHVALVANHTSTIDGVHLCDTLRSLGVDLVSVFCPEHGFRGTADAGEKIDDSNDKGLRIVSLYGKNKKPTAEQMKGIDVVLYDLQDVGARFYTYISTMHLMMEACASAQATFVVLDRPNPHGSIVDGPVLQPKYRSFVGKHPIPVVYGLTCGELACMIQGEGWLEGDKKCDLKVVEMTGYQPNKLHALACSPSPNLRSPEAIWLYPSLCLFEGTKVSVGRGTDNPFTVVGAPSKQLEDSCTFSFVPQPNIGAKQPMYQGVACYGEDLSAAETRGFGAKYLVKYHSLMGDSVFWENERFFDLLAGSDVLRKQIKNGLSAEEIEQSWQADLQNYEAKRQKYLLYGSAAQNTITEPINWQTAMQSAWVDSVINRLSIDEKIAQLIWVTLNAYPSQCEKANVLRACAQHKAGGVLIMQNTIAGAHKFICEAQEMADVPIFFAIDGENGIARKLADAQGFPLNISLGAITDTMLLHRTGLAMARQMKAVGFDMNFAPVADVNTNPQNPIIGVRAFGARAENVAEKATMISLGMQDGGCVAVLKHFPGHGDTSSDSHVALPVVRNSLNHVQTTDLVPFARATQRGTMGVMSAHVAVPALDPSGRAASLSAPMLKTLLREKIGFKGLIISDAMNMAGIRISSGKKNAEADALAAGNDVAEFSLDIEGAIREVRQSLERGELDSLELDQKVRRVLAAKEWCGLAAPQRKFGAPEVLVNSIENELLIDSLYLASVTLLADPDSTFIQPQAAEYYALGSWQDVRLRPVGSETPQRFAQQASGKKIFLFCDDTSIQRCNALLSALPKGQSTVIVYAGNPYKLSGLHYQRPSTAVVVAYEKNARAKKAVLRTIFDGEEMKGIFPL